MRVKARGIRQEMVGRMPGWSTKAAASVHIDESIGGGPTGGPSPNTSSLGLTLSLPPLLPLAAANGPISGGSGGRASPSPSDSELGFVQVAGRDRVQ